MPEAGTMPLLEHLVELRRRLIYVFLGISAAAGVCYFWANDLFALLTLPIRQTFINLQLIGTGPAEAFVTKLQIAGLAGVICSVPLILYQAWRFIVPGLREDERRLALPFIFWGTVFFLCGVLFCYYVALPSAFRFFSDEFQSVAIIPQIKIGEYLNFALKLLLVFGLTFEMPLIVYFLGRLGLVTRQWLITKFRYAVLVIFIAAGVLTPPDVISQMMLAGPLLGLYGLCILVCPAARSLDG